MLSVTVHNRSSQRKIGEHIQCATTSWTRLVGLLGRTGLAAGEGLWISPSSGVHTMGMRFTIDVVGLDREIRIVRLWPLLRPYRMTVVDTRVKSVLELGEGQIAKLGLCAGDQLYFESAASMANSGVKPCR